MGQQVIAYARHTITRDDLRAVRRVLLSDRLTQGPEVPRFEAALARACGTAQAVALSSGTAALEAMFGGLAPGRVVVPALTFVATAAAAARAGHEVVFADVEPEHLCLSPSAAERIVTAKTRGPDDRPPLRAVVAVDFAGHPCEWSALRQVAGRRAFLLGDCAHSLGATYRAVSWWPSARFPDASALSFHPAKAITTGEGGAVVSSETSWAHHATAWRDHGRVHGLARVVGTNARMTDIQAALGISQLRRLRPNIARRTQIAESYLAAFDDLPALRLPSVAAWARSAWHLFVIRVPAASRDAFRARLAKRDVGTQVHYPVVYDHPAFAHLRPEGGCPVAERAAREVVSLPLFPGLTAREIDRVIDAVRGATRRL